MTENESTTKSELEEDIQLNNDLTYMKGQVLVLKDQLESSGWLLIVSAENIPKTFWRRNIKGYKMTEHTSTEELNTVFQLENTSMFSLNYVVSILHTLVDVVMANSNVTLPYTSDYISKMIETLLDEANNRVEEEDEENESINTESPSTRKKKNNFKLRYREEAIMAQSLLKCLKRKLCLKK